MSSLNFKEEIMIFHKTKYLLLINFLMLSLFSCSTIHIHNAEQVNIPDDFLGFVHAGRSFSSEEYQLLNTLGTSWILETFYWSRIEKEQGVFDFSWYDNYVNFAKANGIKVIAVMAYDTSWIKAKDEKYRYISPDNYIHFLNFLETAVNHFKGRVDVWQVWNEPNWIFWNGTDKEFYELSRLSAKRIRETDPNAYIIGGGYSRVPVAFIKGMNRAGAMEHLDAISFHPYATTPKAAMQLHDSLIKTLKEINFTGDVWITEMGYPTDGWYPHKAPLDKLPSYVVKTIVGAAIRNPKVLMWYELSDAYNYGEAPNNHDSEMFFGLTYPDRSRKKGSYAFELCARYLSGSKYLPALPIRDNIPSNIVSFCFTKASSKNNTLILWNDRNSAQKIKISLSSSFTVHDISTGNSILMPDESILDVTNTPVFITWQGENNVRLTRAVK